MDEENGPIVDKLAEVERLLEEYEGKIGLGNITTKEPDLNISREQILAMHPDDIMGLAWEYAGYSLFLQKCINKHQSRYLWADTNLKRTLERNCGEYIGWKWEERQSNCLNESECAQKLHKLKLSSKMVIERTSFLTNKIHFLAELCKDIAYQKRMERKNAQHND